MTSWKKSIASPFKKACTFFNQPQPTARDHHKKSQPVNENSAMNLHGEVMACGYEDVQVMWSILDKSKSANSGFTSS
ncbi:uncharacterized protein LOC126667423 [Mercurialis annua]|uniref:uncharacterized protein LOC126667423 n=1 Tax=Mercurialis annua TaxID=3986 RepID=UPI00215F1611|nr:uncharacterized protein LOC126667423 [Mercurialis annua]